MGIFFLFECCTFSLACCNDLVRKLFRHASTVSFTAETNQPFHTQGNLTIGTNFRRDLESSATNTTTSHFNCWSNVRQCFFPNLVSVFTGLFADPVYCIVEYV